MKKYMVTVLLPITLEVEVSANNLETAKEKALKSVKAGTYLGKAHEGPLTVSKVHIVE